MQFFFSPWRFPVFPSCLPFPTCLSFLEAAVSKTEEKRGGLSWNTWMSTYSLPRPSRCLQCAHKSDWHSIRHSSKLWLVGQGQVLGFLQVTSGALDGAAGVPRLPRSSASEDLVTILQNMTKGYFYAGYPLRLSVQLCEGNSNWPCDDPATCPWCIPPPAQCQPRLTAQGNEWVPGMNLQQSRESLLSQARCTESEGDSNCGWAGWRSKTGERGWRPQGH